MDNKKHLESVGVFAGLWVRTAESLRGGGYKSRLEIWLDISDGTLRPYISIRDYGRKADIEVITWLLEHGDISFGAAKAHFENVYGECAHDILRTLEKKIKVSATKRTPILS